MRVRLCKNKRFEAAREKDILSMKNVIKSFEKIYDKVIVD